MKTLIIALLAVCCFQAVRAQEPTATQDLRGKYYHYHQYITADSGYLFYAGDTTYHPFRPTLCYRSADKSLYLYDMDSWHKLTRVELADTARWNDTYTIHQTDSLLVLKSDTEHTHQIPDVVGLNDSLSNKYTKGEADSRFINLDQKGSANGVPSLDGGGKIPFTQLPASLMIYKGTWNASTNTPALADGIGTIGWVYRTSAYGIIDLGHGLDTFDVGDYAIYNGAQWEYSPGSDGVKAIKGEGGATKQGIVSLNTDDVSEGDINLYYTNTRARSSVSASSPLSYNSATGTFSLPTGSGSGLDADLLDGQHASAFQPAGNYPLDADVVHKAGTEAISGSKTFTSSTSFNATTVFRGAADFVGFGGSNYLSFTTPTGSVSGGPGVTNFGINADGNPQWVRHGLFGDTFVFDPANGHTYTFPTTGGTLALTSDLSAYQPAGDYVTQSNPRENDLNTAIGANKLVVATSTATNTPYTTSYFSGFNFMIDNNPIYNYQLGFTIDGNIYSRSNPGSTWGLWHKIWKDDNDGTGSGLDADLLDGLHASGFNLQKVTDNGSATTNSIGIKTIPDAQGFTLQNPSGTLRWIVRTSGVESGSDTGSDLIFQARHDDGGPGANGLMIERSTGNLGIGTTAPLYKLHSYSANNTGQVAAMIAGHYYGPAVGTESTSSTYYAFDVLSGITDASSSAAGGSSLFRVRADGNVGIGTTTPSDKLEVNGKVRGNMFSSYEGATPIGYFSRGQSLTSGWAATPDVLAITYQNRDFAIGGWGKADNVWHGASFFINSDNGNVGIGTTSPSDKLDVNGNIALSGTNGTIHPINNSTRTFITGGHTTTNADGSWIGLQGNDYSGTGLGGSISMALGNVGNSYLNVFGANGAEIMRLTRTGELGIGVVSPAFKLHTYSANNTAKAAAVIAGQYYGPVVATESTSAPYYALDVRAGIVGTTGAGGTSLLYVGADGNVGLNTTSPNSTLQVAGSLSLPVRVMTGNITLTKDDYTIVNRSTSGAFPDIILPDPSAIPGRIYVFVNDGVTDSNSIGWSGYPVTYNGATITRIRDISSTVNRVTIQAVGSVYVVISAD